MGAARRTFSLKFYQELGFESLQQRHCYRKLSCLFKIINNQSPSISFQIALSRKYSPTSCKTLLFLKLLFPLDYKRMEQSETASQYPRASVFLKAIF